MEIWQAAALYAFAVLSLAAVVGIAYWQQVARAWSWLRRQLRAGSERRDGSGYK